MQGTVVIAMLLWALQAPCFHGEDYFGTRNGPSFSGKNVFSFLSFTYGARDQGSDRSDYWEMRPGLGYAFTDWLYLGMDCALGGYGPAFLTSSKRASYPAGTSLLLESVGFDVIFAMTDSGKVPVELGIVFFYRCPTDRAVDMIGRDHRGGFTLVLSEGYGKGHNSTLNLSYWRDGRKDHFQWAAASAFQIAQSGAAAFKIGIELVGDYTGHVTMIPGANAVIAQSFAVKTGVSIGLSQYTREHRNDGNKEDDLALHLAVVKKW